MTRVLISVTALLVSVAILLMGHGLQLTLVPLYADELGWSPTAIGYLGSSYFVGFVIGCITVPRLVARVGHIRVFGALSSVATAALLGLGVVQDPVVWALARVATGWSFAGLYMVIESWLNERSGAESRGGVLSIYAIITLVAICIGQTFVGFDISYIQLAMVGAMLISLGTIPVGLARIPSPEPIPAVSFKLRDIYGVSHVAVVGAALGGVVTGAFWSLGPVIAKAQGLATNQVGMFMAVTILGGAVFQMPIGRLSDYMDRRLVVLGLALLGVAVSVLATVVHSFNTIWLYGLMFVFGGVTFPLYSLCLAHANDNTDRSIMEVASVVLLMSSAGSIVGPILVAFVLGFNSYALFMVTGAVLGVLALFTAYRVRVHDVARRFFRPFLNVPRTTQGVVPLASAEEELVEGAGNTDSLTRIS